MVEQQRIRRGIQSKVQVIQIIILKHAAAQEVSETRFSPKAANLATTKNTATVQNRHCASAASGSLLGKPTTKVPLHYLLPGMPESLHLN